MGKLVLTTTFRGDEVEVMMLALRRFTGGEYTKAQQGALMKLVRLHKKWVDSGRYLSTQRSRIPYKKISAYASKEV